MDRQDRQDFPLALKGVSFKKGSNLADPKSGLSLFESAIPTVIPA